MQDSKFVFLPDNNIKSAQAKRIGLMGYVGDYDFSAQYLIPYLKEYRDQEIQLEMYSFGGLLIEAFAILDYIQSNAIDCTAYIFGFCGSAATVLSAGCKATYMGENSFFFIHNSFNPYGEEDEVNAMLDNRMVEIYSAKTGKDKAQIKEWMDTEKTWSANEAIEIGFADGLIADSDYMQQAAQFNKTLIKNRKNNEMKFENFKAVWNSIFPSSKIEKEEEIEAKLKEVATIKPQESESLKQVEARLAQTEANLENLSALMADTASMLAEIKAGNEQSEVQKEQEEKEKGQLEQSLNELRKQMNAIKAIKKPLPGTQPSAHVTHAEGQKTEGTEVKAKNFTLPNKIFTHN